MSRGRPTWPPPPNDAAGRLHERPLPARGGHDLVHERFCLELMVAAIEEIYDEGARAVRLVGVSAAR